MLACCARFDRWHSGVLLAIGMGIFAQGVGAYGFAPLLSVAACRQVSMASGTAAGWASQFGCSLQSISTTPALLTYTVCPVDVASLQTARALSCRRPADGM